MVGGRVKMLVGETAAPADGRGRELQISAERRGSAGVRCVGLLKASWTGVSREDSAQRRRAQCQCWQSFSLSRFHPHGERSDRKKPDLK